jgi:hypothetical protein
MESRLPELKDKLPLEQYGSLLDFLDIFYGEFEINYTSGYFSSRQPPSEYENGADFWNTFICQLKKCLLELYNSDTCHFYIDNIDSPIENILKEGNGKEDFLDVRSELGSLLTRWLKVSKTSIFKDSEIIIYILILNIFSINRVHIQII